VHKGFIGDEGCRVQVNVTVAVKSEDEGGEEAGDVWVGAVLVRCRIRRTSIEGSGDYPLTCCLVHVGIMCTRESARGAQLDAGSIFLTDMFSNRQTACSRRSSLAPYCPRRELSPRAVGRPGGRMHGPGAARVGPRPPSLARTPTKYC